MHRHQPGFDPLTVGTLRERDVALESLERERPLPPIGEGDFAPPDRP
jgi:hypothetical protein